MRQFTRIAILALLFITGCRRAPSPEPGATAFGVAILDTSGETRVAEVGATLDQPLTAQVNDADGNGIAGARVEFSGSGIEFDRSSGLTGSDGVFSTKARLGTTSGRYSIVATTRDKTGKTLQVTFPAIALDYQQTLGRELSEKHCARCHDSRSTAERVSNHDNLSAPPHEFSDGSALNKISPANLTAIIAHGGAALGKSPEMPPYSPTLSASEIDALAAYIRAVADPPYRP
jgi:mono/diheme cytochrome c family protein